MWLQSFFLNNFTGYKFTVMEASVYIILTKYFWFVQYWFWIIDFRLFIWVINVNGFFISFSSLKLECVLSLLIASLLHKIFNCEWPWKLSIYFNRIFTFILIINFLRYHFSFFNVSCFCLSQMLRIDLLWEIIWIYLIFCDIQLIFSYYFNIYMLSTVF